MAANALMGIGIAPIVLWLVFLGNAYIFASAGNAGLSDLMLLVVFGAVAYLATLVFAGIGALWAARILRRMAGPGPQLTTALLIATGIVLVLPWIGVLGAVAVRSIK